MKTKISITCMLFIAFAFININSANAGNDWKNYFAVDEAKEIKKMVKKSVIHELENPDDDWKNLIRGKSIKDGAISARHLKEGSLLKKTIYTLKIECNKEFADRVEHEEDDEDDINFYKKIDMKEMKLSNPPSITVYGKKIDEDDNSWMENGWRVLGSRNIVSEGEFWIRYGSEEIGEDPFHCMGYTDYKIVVVN